MALDGTAYARVVNRLAAYMEGATPDELTPVVAGAAVPFVHNAQKTMAAATEAGLLVADVLVAYVRSRLDVGAQYTWRGDTWQVMPTDGETGQSDRAAGVDWPHKIVLVRHAR